MSRVSIITPAYNASKYLEETVRSVQSQSYSDWEMIIVDDCSSDGTFALASKLAEKDKRIRVLQNKANLGPAMTRNTALDAAQGEYIAFLDADDIWLPEKLKKQVAFMDANNCVLSYTDYQKFDSVTDGVKGECEGTIQGDGGSVLGLKGSQPGESKEKEMDGAAICRKYRPSCSENEG